MSMQVEAAGERVVETVSAQFDALKKRSSELDPKPCKPCVVYDAANNAVWLHVLKGSHVRSHKQMHSCDLARMPFVRSILLDSRRCQQSRQAAQSQKLRSLMMLS